MVCHRPKEQKRDLRQRQPSYPSRNSGWRRDSCRADEIRSSLDSVCPGFRGSSAWPGPESGPLADFEDECAFGEGNCRLGVSGWELGVLPYTRGLESG